jgi:hypothetical protein
MKQLQKQHGISAIALIIVLALIGVGVYIGLQYIPQQMEEKAIDAILDDVEKAYAETPPKNIKDLQGTLNKYLTINRKEGLKDNFKITKENDKYILKADFEWMLNLLYEQKTIKYNRELYL